MDQFLPRKIKNPQMRRLAYKVFSFCGRATANDMSFKRILVRGTANVNVSDDRSRRLASEMS